jgi:ribonuclease HI
MQQRLDRFFKIKEAPAIFNPFDQETYVPPPKKPVQLLNVLDSPVKSPTSSFSLQKKEPESQNIAQEVPFTSLVPLEKPKVHLFPDAEIIPMIQPQKDGKRLLYKYPKLPKVGPRGSYDLLVGESDRSEAAWLMQFDGAANPNPGPASSGAVLWSPKDLGGKRSPIFESGKFLGKATNNIAEVQGLLLGLQIAAVRGARELLIEGDSELIIFQQTGRYRVSDKNLKVWWANIQAALMDETSFDWIAIKQVPREQNERADSITKEVLSKKQSFQRA